MHALLVAGKLIWGKADASSDSGAALIELYDLSSDGKAAPRSYAIENGVRGAHSYAGAATTLMKDLQRPPSADGGDRGTASYAAWRAYGAGHIALAQWDLPSAIQHFRKSVGADPNYAAGRLWLAQVGAWTQRDASVDWKAEARRALTGRSAFSTRDSLLSEGLAALADGEYPRACASYRRLTSLDSSDFAGWYGLGDCQSLDQAVLPDPESPSRMRFGAAITRLCSLIREHFDLHREPTLGSHRAGSSACFRRHQHYPVGDRMHPAVITWRTLPFLPTHLRSFPIETRVCIASPDCNGDARRRVGPKRADPS